MKMLHRANFRTCLRTLTPVWRTRSIVSCRAFTYFCGFSSLSCLVLGFEKGRRLQDKSKQYPRGYRYVRGFCLFLSSSLSSGEPVSAQALPVPGTSTNETAEANSTRFLFRFKGDKRNQDLYNYSYVYVIKIFYFNHGNRNGMHDEIWFCGT